jgi:hypothetical protein
MAVPTREAVAVGAATPSSGYDAFVSYSYAADGRLAPALQAGLQSLAKLWDRRRALRLFWDKASLLASPELWPAIERVLAQAPGVIATDQPAPPSFMGPARLSSGGSSQALAGAVTGSGGRCLSVGPEGFHGDALLAGA